MNKRIVSAGIVFLFVIGGLTMYEYTTSAAGPVSEPKIPGDRAAVSPEELEAFLMKNTVTEQVAQAYRIAYENPQNILSQVKCYCGCLDQGHDDNRDCFFNDDGSIDLMGLNCGLCVKTAIVSQELLSEGKTIQEISDYVDNRWGPKENEVAGIN